MTVPDRIVTEMELRRSDGERGSRKYVAHNGIVYDVTDCPKWRPDLHENLHFPGHVLEFVHSARHGRENSLHPVRCSFGHQQSPLGPQSTYSGGYIGQCASGGVGPPGTDETFEFRRTDQGGAGVDPHVDVQRAIEHGALVLQPQRLFSDTERRAHGVQSAAFLILVEEEDHQPVPSGFIDIPVVRINGLHKNREVFLDDVVNHSMAQTLTKTGVSAYVQEEN